VLIALGDELREQLIPSASLRGATGAAARQQLEARYAEALAADDRRLVVAACTGPQGEEILAMGLMSIGSTNSLVDVPAVYLSNAIVADRHRRRGAGRALVAAAAAYADEKGIEQIVVTVHPADRDANRFLARLGFAPVDVRRAAPVSSVRRRLMATELGPIEHMVRRRRIAVRRGGRGAALPLGPASSGEE
jgi:ribosomal protein S18 acetylase RimI-like enzyme